MTDAAGRTAPGGPGDRLLGWRRVQDVAGISRSTAWRLQRAGDFPAPVQVSPGRVAWWESELAAWKAARLPGGPPPPKGRTLKPARIPKLPGVAAGAPVRRPAAPVVVESRTQGRFDLAPAEPISKPRARRKTGASPDQIDFGF